MENENNEFNGQNEPLQTTESIQPPVEENPTIEPITPVVEEPVAPVAPVVEPKVELENTTMVDTNPVVQEEQKTEDENPVLGEESNTNTPKKKKSKKPLVIVLAILAVVLVGVAIWFLIKGNNNGTSTTISGNKYKTDYRLSGNSLEDFDLYFLQLENGKENKIYSPLSIKYALEMLMEGAEGDSKAQIEAIIGDYEARKYTNSENMSLANAIFIRDTFKDSVKEEYTTLLQNKFDAELVFDPFENPDNINKWIKEKTLNLLDNVVDSVDDLNFALVNALAIDMEWEEKFFDNEKTLSHKTMTMYEHERIPNSEYRYGWIYTKNSILHAAKFDNMDEEISALKIKASFNRYDIIKELGEDKIRQTVREEYQKSLDGMSAEDFELHNGAPKSDEKIKEIVDSYDYDRYIEEISKNYNDVAYITDFSFYVDDDVKVFAKDLKEYNGTTLQYVGIMPTNVALDSYISNTNAKKINTLLSNLKPMKLESFKEGYVTEIDGFVPKFDFEYTLPLTKDLKSLGVNDIFELDKANLNGISTSPLYVRTLHKAKIEFTQYGIKAAAATMAGGAGAAGPWDYYFEVPFERIDLTFNKPYMFIIRDKATGEVWFAGTVYNPLLWSQDTTKPDQGPFYKN